MKEQVDDMICRAREWVLDEMMTGEAIMHERKHKKIILTAICQAVQSVMGRSDTQYPSSIRKVTTSTINDVLHQWKRYIDCHLFSTLRLRPDFEGPKTDNSVISEDKRKKSRTESVKNLLEDLSFLKDAQEPSAFHFSASLFQHLVMDHLFEHSPRMGRFVDHTALQPMLNNLFALGAAAIAASVRKWEEGEKEVQIISPDMWQNDYHHAKERIETMRLDDTQREFLTNPQDWMVKQG